MGTIGAKERSRSASSGLGQFVDRLIQTFEDCRDGLSDQVVAQGEEKVGGYFLELYEREGVRLTDTIRNQAPHLSNTAQETLRSEIDTLIRKVVVPAYTRLVRQYTPRERNDFYLLRPDLHGLERAGWALAGVLLGTFVILVPFIPLWSKEWILPFMLVGLFFPNIRRYLAIGRYERELNELVQRTARELERIDVAYLANGDLIPELRDASMAGSEEERTLKQRLAQLSSQKEGSHKDG